MKKLMMTAAALVAGVAMADIVSSDVVGYMSITGKTGFTMMTPTFVGIGTDYSIQDIKLNGAMGMGGETIQFVDADGNTLEYYTYFDEMIMGVTGWYDGSMQLAARLIDPAESFLVSNDAGSYTIQVKGKVDYAGVPALDGLAGFTSVGNMTPVSKDIQKFALTGATGMGGETLQFVDEGGNSLEYYTWFDAMIMGVTGWYDGSMLLSDREILAGEGFMIGNDAGNYTIAIPGTDE